MKKKNFNLIDAILMAVCVILVVESSAPAASIGPSQFFWWFFMLGLFFLPYGLISAELGTAYDSDGGLFDWTKKAFGPRWGGRVAWNYWINFPLWMASLAVLFTSILAQIFELNIPLGWQIVIQLAFIWFTVIVSLFQVSDSKWILNVAALFKVVMMLSLGALGIYVAMTKGVANDYSLSALAPSLDSTSLSFISIIIFNFVGFEIVTSMAPQMKKPQHDIPKALVLGGSLIAFFYLFSAFGMGVAIPTDELTADVGLLESFAVLLGGNNWFVIVMGLFFLYTLAANLISWAYGVNYVASYAARHGGLPKIFAKTNKNDMPIAASLLNGAVATLLVLVAPFIPNEEIFWSFFALNVVTLLLSYVTVFPAFLKLRRIDPLRPRPFRVKLEGRRLSVLAYVPMIILIWALAVTVLPLSELISSNPIANFTAALPDFLPLLVGTIVSIVVGELVIHFSLKRHRTEPTNQETKDSTYKHTS